MSFPELINLSQAYFTKYHSKLYPVCTIVLFFIGTMLIVIGVFFSKLAPVQAKSADKLMSSSPKELHSQESLGEKMMVDVAGAVVHPGLYTLNSGQRLSAAIEAAGGFHPKANKNFLAHSLNLAQKLTDEEKIYIPFQGERGDNTALQSQSSQSLSAHASSLQNLININTASQAELETLIGVGEVRAKKIISGRPFKTIQELVQKGVLTQKIYIDNKEKIKI